MKSCEECQDTVEQPLTCFKKHGSLPLPQRYSFWFSSSFHTNIYNVIILPHFSCLYERITAYLPQFRKFQFFFSCVVLPNELNENMHLGFGSQIHYVSLQL
jgi:hypothetical protein